jgi:hypothetical protein
MIRLNRVVVLAALASGPVAAQETRGPLAPFPRFSVDVAVELESDIVVDASDSDAEFSDTYPTVTTSLAFEIGEGSGLFSTLTFEPVLDADDDRFFGDLGLYVEELYLQYDAGLAAVRGGKFNPTFGRAHDIAPGIYGADFAGDYELLERLGFGLAVPFALGDGEHVLSASLYAADTTGLSNSIITKRGKVSKADGGPANTESLESFAIDLTGGFGDFTYGVGFLREARGEGDDSAQTGGVFGLGYGFDIGAGRLELLGEAAYLDGYLGGPGDGVVGTFAAAYGFGDFTLSGVYAIRDVSDGYGTDHLATASLDYAVNDAVTASIGYRFGDEDGLRSHTVGLYLVFGFGFVSPD